MLDQDTFILPVFRCPIYDTVNKINGTNSYTYADLVQQVSYSQLDIIIKPCPIRINCYHNFSKMVEEYVQLQEHLLMMFMIQMQL